MALAKLVASSERLIVALQEVQVVEPLGETVQFLFDGLLSLAYSREIEISIASLQPKADLLEVVGVVFVVFLYVLI